MYVYDISACILMRMFTLFLTSPLTYLLYFIFQVPSGEHCRTVGYEDPVSGQVVWFNLTDGPLHFIPDLGLYFKLQHNGSASSHH